MYIKELKTNGQVVKLYYFYAFKSDTLLNVHN